MDWHSLLGALWLTPVMMLLVGILPLFWIGTRRLPIRSKTLQLRAAITTIVRSQYV